MQKHFANCSFNPETMNILTSAFDAAWNVIEESGASLANDASTKELLAKRIIETASRGERDPTRLADDALAHLPFPIARPGSPSSRRADSHSKKIR
jgi:hypothetical protein